MMKTNKNIVTYFWITSLNTIQSTKDAEFTVISPFLPGFCKSMKRDTDKVVMVYTVEITDAMTPKQWLHGQFQNVNYTCKSVTLKVISMICFINTLSM